MSDYLPENDFQAHADALGDYQAIMVDNVQPTAQGATNAPGTIIYGVTTPAAPNAPDPAIGKVYPAIILPVELCQLPREMGGAFVPKLLATVSINKDVLPAGTALHTNQFLYINPVWSAQRLCQIFKYVDCFTSWLIAVVDVSANV